MEIIFATIAAALSSLLTNWFNRRGMRIKNDSDSDKVLMVRIKFLDERVTKLERLACFNTECKQRV